MTACARDGDILPPFNPGDLHGGSLVVSIPKTVLGDKLENPYSVSNMRLALESLSPEEAAGLSVDDISTSHLYVKFKPKNDEELDLLKTDSTLMLYDFPLDYEILEPGEYYHDPEIPDSLPTYQYASVPFSQRSAVDALGVEYEVLENLFIPDEDKDFVENSETRAVAVRLDASVADALVDRALELTGNAEEPLVQTRASKWRPAGRITYYDEVLKKTIGLEGVRVRAYRWFTTHTGIVNENGYYSCDGRFRQKANYRLNFERAHFEVLRNKNSHWIDGPKKRGNWDLHFSREANQMRYFMATAFRACRFFCYKDIEHLCRPPQANFLRAKIKVRCMNEDKNVDGKFTSGTWIVSGKHIEIYNPHNLCDEIYATTIHELAHSAHWRQDRSFYQDKVEKIVKETWARGVEVYFTSMVYPDYYAHYNRGRYTGLVEDLMDGFGTTSSNRYYFEKEKDLPKSYEDKVSGYTIKQIETAMLGSKTFTDWKNRLKSKYPNNATKDNLDAAFTYWSSR